MLALVLTLSIAAPLPRDRVQLDPIRQGAVFAVVGDVGDSRVYHVHVLKVNGEFVWAEYLDKPNTYLMTNREMLRASFARKP